MTKMVGSDRPAPATPDQTLSSVRNPGQNFEGFGTIVSEIPLPLWIKAEAFCAALPLINKSFAKRILASLPLFSILGQKRK